MALYGDTWVFSGSHEIGGGGAGTKAAPAALGQGESEQGPRTQPSTHERERVASCHAGQAWTQLS